MRKSLKAYIDGSYLAEKRANPKIGFQVYGTVIRRIFFPIVRF